MWQEAVAVTFRLTGQQFRLRRRTGDPAAKIDLICDDEIRLAILKALDVQFNASREDAVLQASRALGFAATHGDTASRIDQVLQAMIAKGEIVFEAGTVRAARPVR